MRKAHRNKLNCTRCAVRIKASPPKVCVNCTATIILKQGAFQEKLDAGETFTNDDFGLRLDAINYLKARTQLDIGRVDWFEVQANWDLVI